MRHPRRAAALPRLLGLLRERLFALVNPYRPYKHYMRGPGPKCRLKASPREARAAVRERPRRER
jgi:hypothetical protein